MNLILLWPVFSKHVVYRLKPCFCVKIAVSGLCSAVLRVRQVRAGRARGNVRRLWNSEPHACRITGRKMTQSVMQLHMHSR